MSAAEFTEYCLPNEAKEICKITPESIKSKLITLQVGYDNMQCLMNTLENSLDANSKLKYDQFKAKQKEYSDQMDRLKKQLKLMTNVIDKRVDKLTLPEDYGLNDSISIEHLRLHCPIFNNTSEGVSLVETWRKLLTFGKMKGLSEDGYKFALSNLLQGPAFDIFFSNQEKSLKEILDVLEGSFTSYQTVLDIESKLENLTRNIGETIGSFMNRVSALLTRTEVLRPLNKQKDYNEIVLLSKLKKNISNKAKLALKNASAKALSHGVTLPYKELLLIAIEQEADKEIVDTRFSVSSAYRPSTSFTNEDFPDSPNQEYSENEETENANFEDEDSNEEEIDSEAECQDQVDTPQIQTIKLNQNFYLPE